MNIDRFTHKAQEALQGSQRIAGRYNHQSVEPEHLLLALLEQHEGLVPRILEGMGVSASALLEKVEGYLQSLPGVTGAGAGQLYLSSRLNRVLALAEQEARNFKDEYISVEHLFLALLQ
ncbi:MAG: type VI secretion system ATPase TssH, partial [Deltaproteobacteria bacterium]